MDDVTDQTEIEDFEPEHADLVNRLIETAALSGQDGGIMLTPDGYPLAAIWPTSHTDEETGETTWVIHVLVSDWTTTTETRNL